jgi:hypothetical protein
MNMFNITVREWQYKIIFFGGGEGVDRLFVFFFSVCRQIYRKKYFYLKDGNNINNLVLQFSTRHFGTDFSCK